MINLVLNGQDLDALVDGYYANYRRLTSANRADRLLAQEGDELSDWLLCLVSPGTIPDVAFDVVVTLLVRVPDEDVLAFVISGPLQDLVDHHAAQFADRLVDRTRQDVLFRHWMTSLYRRQRVPPALQARLAAVIERGSRPSR